MDFHGNSMEIHGIPWIFMEFINSMEFHESPWKVHGIL
jgi:hypothetical protein